MIFCCSSESNWKTCKLFSIKPKYFKLKKPKKNTEKVKNNKMQTNQCQHAESELKIKCVQNQSYICVKRENCICILLHQFSITIFDKLCLKSSD